MTNIINQFDNIIDFRGQVTKINLKAHYEWADIFLLPSLLTIIGQLA